MRPSCVARSRTPWTIACLTVEPAARAATPKVPVVVPRSTSFPSSPSSTPTREAHSVVLTPRGVRSSARNSPRDIYLRVSVFFFFFITHSSKRFHSAEADRWIGGLSGAILGNETDSLRSTKKNNTRKSWDVYRSGKCKKNIYMYMYFFFRFRRLFWYSSLFAAHFTETVKIRLSRHKVSRSTRENLRTGKKKNSRTIWEQATRWIKRESQCCGVRERANLTARLLYAHVYVCQVDVILCIKFYYLFVCFIFFFTRTSARCFRINKILSLGRNAFVLFVLVVRSVVACIFFLFLSICEASLDDATSRVLATSTVAVWLTESWDWRFRRPRSKQRCRERAHTQSTRSP